MKRNLFSLLALVLLISSTLIAQVPQGYYDSTTGLSGDALKNALNSIIKGHTEYPYSSTATDVWDILKEADRDPNNSNNVLCLYSKFSVDAAAEYNNAAGWNREHVWAKSRGNFGTTKGAGTDLHHLRAADVSTNSARNNRNFDEAPNPYVDNGGVNNGSTPSYTSDVDWIWEPPADVKGDVARMLMYMAVRYEGLDGEPDLELQEAYLDKSSTAPGQARLSTLIQWHLSDPVDAEERRRNDVVYSYQNNRNPFIDHPEFVCEIYDCGITPPVNSAPEFTSMVVTDASENIAYTYNIVAVDADNDNLNFSAGSLPSWLNMIDNGDGTAVLSGTPLAANVGANSISISVSDGQVSTVQSFQITVAGENSGGVAGDLFFSEYVEGSSYNKALEIANFTGVDVNLSTYTIKKQTNGAGDWSSGLNLSGSLANQDVYVSAHSSAVADITSGADYTGSVGEMSFNGNDAIGLFKNDVLIDIIGNFNGGSTSFAADKTLRRKVNIGSPNTIYTVSEWDVLSKDVFTGLGSHTFDGSIETPDVENPTVPGNLTSTNVAENSFDISWTASTDNVAVTTYKIYLDDILVASQLSTAYDFSSLNSGTTYIVKVMAEDKAGNTSSATQLSVTTQSAPSSQVLIASDFESGWDNWVDGGSDASRYSGSRSYQGYYSIDLQDNSGSRSSMTSPAFDIRSYNQIDIEFYYYSYSMEANEDFFVKYYDGSSWQTVATFVSGVDFDNNNYYVATLSFDASQYNFAADAKFRFQCDASSNSDDIYVDLVTIKALTGGTKSNYTDKVTSTFVRAGLELENGSQEEMSIYPNPASDYFTLDLILDEEIDLDIRIYDINGRLVSSKKEMNCIGSYSKQVDISNLVSGVYMLVVKGHEIRFSKRLVVK